MALVRYTIRSKDGTERSETREAKSTERGLVLSGLGLSLQDGDRVVWVSDVPGLFGAFTVHVTSPTVH